MMFVVFCVLFCVFFFFFQAEDGIRDIGVTGVQTCALPIYRGFGENDLRLLVVSPDASNCDEINDLLEHCVTLFSGTNTLLVSDYCAVSKDLKKRSNKFINLGFSGKHEGLSV